MSKVKQFFRNLGPGLITGAADDDPSGIATYTIAGAKLGNSLLWTALLSWPLMAGVQLMCARVALNTGRGLGAAFKQKFPKPLLLLACLALLAANTINIAADLAGMADAVSVLSGWRSGWCVVIFAAALILCTVFFSYRQITRCLKWLCLTLLAYPLVAFIAKPDWREVARSTFIPTWPSGHEAWANLVAILGTTISPYLFFWQSAQEVEETKAAAKRKSGEGGRRPESVLSRRTIDVVFGAFASNMVMFFIITTAAATLHRHGLTDIKSSRDAAEALKPLAGRYATALYAAGIIGVGLLAIPTLAGSSAYALADTLDWRQGLNLKFKQGVRFYLVIMSSIAAAAVMNAARFNAMTALFWTSVINGLLAPLMLLGMLWIVRDREVMRGQGCRPWVFWTTAAAMVLMFGAAIGMFAF